MKKVFLFVALMGGALLVSSCGNKKVQEVTQQAVESVEDKAHDAIEKGKAMVDSIAQDSVKVKEFVDTLKSKVDHGVQKIEKKIEGAVQH